MKSTSNVYTIGKHLSAFSLLFVAAAVSAQEYPPHYDPSRYGKAFAVKNDGTGSNARLETYCHDPKGHVVEEGGATIPENTEIVTHFPWEDEGKLSYEVWLDGARIAENLPKGHYSLCKSGEISAAGEEYKPLLNPNSGESYAQYCANKSSLFQPARGTQSAPALRGSASNP